MNLKSWSDVFFECRAVDVDLLASMLRTADMDGRDTRMQIIREVGGAST